VDHQTIMVVDDQTGIRLLLKEILKREGYAILLAENGSRALELLSRRPALVLLDVRLPGIRGTDLLRQIGRQCPETKVVMMTAYGDRDLIAETKAGGAVGYLEKPFDIPKLIAIVHREAPVGPLKNSNAD
jgi:two-component system response regulator (stage 0 sporulation protein F)